MKWIWGGRGVENDTGTETETEQTEREREGGGIEGGRERVRAAETETDGGI